jgi:hypothetical protein
MPKNILILTGSRKGYDSEQLVDAFIAGAERAGNTVAKCNFWGIIGHCACGGFVECYSRRFNKLLPPVKQVEILVFAMPRLGSMEENTTHKWYSFFTAQRALKIKQCILLACGGDERKGGFAVLVEDYESLVNLSGWKDAGQIIVTGDILKTDALQRAEKLGESITRHPCFRFFDFFLPFTKTRGK